MARAVLQGDALDFLEQGKLEEAVINVRAECMRRGIEGNGTPYCFVTSLPDMCEMKHLVRDQVNGEVV